MAFAAPLVGAIASGIGGAGAAGSALGAAGAGAAGSGLGGLLGSAGGAAGTLANGIGGLGNAAGSIAGGNVMQGIGQGINAISSLQGMKGKGDSKGEGAMASIMQGAQPQNTGYQDISQGMGGNLMQMMQQAQVPQQEEQLPFMDYFNRRGY